MRVLFVCLGNICRSPTAEGVVRKLVADAGLAALVELDSAGTGAWHTGEPPDSRSIRHAAKRGVDLSMLRARQVRLMDFVAFDHVIAMDGDNLAKLRAFAPPDHVGKISLFLDVLGVPDQPVPDPWSGGAKEFEHVLDLCERGGRAWVQRIQGELARVR